MLGAFEQMFFAHNLGIKSVLVGVYTWHPRNLCHYLSRWSRGMVMGNSILFHRTYTRIESFKRGAKSGIKILISLIPVLCVAAFFEGYVTRHTGDARLDECHHIAGFSYLYCMVLYLVS